MAPNTLEIKDKVQRYLADIIGNVGIDRDGNYHFQHGSCHVFVGVQDYGEENTVVNVYSPTNLQVPPSPELYKYIAIRAGKFVFGSLSIQEQDDGLMVLFGHRLLGEFLDPDELKVAVSAVASTADEIDNQIQEQFGGTIFHEE